MGVDDYIEEQLDAGPAVMKSTKRCPDYPEYLAKNKPTMPIAHMTDEEIDEFMRLLRQQGKIFFTEVPKTKYGRRLVVAAVFELEHAKE